MIVVIVSLTIRKGKIRRLCRVVQPEVRDLARFRHQTALAYEQGRSPVELSVRNIRAFYDRSADPCIYRERSIILKNYVSVRYHTVADVPRRLRRAV